MIARLNGAVRSVETRSGEKNGKAWSMRFARVQFADLDFVEVTLNDRDDVRVGDNVDWLIRVESRGGFLSVGHFGDYIDNATPAQIHAVESALA